MPQTPITDVGPIDAPTIYTVPGSQSIVPVSCYAEFDAGGAAQSFLATLLIRSQSGAPIAYIAQPVEIAPGDYVEATWAPFLREARAQASPAATLPYAYTGCPSTSIPSGLGGTTIPTMGLITDDAGIFSIQSTGGNQGLQIAQVGHYLSFTTAICLALGGTQTAHLGVASALVNKGNFLYGTADFTIYGKCSFAELYEVTPSDLTDVIRFTVENQTGVSRDVLGYRVVIQLDTIDPSGDPF